MISDRRNWFLVYIYVLFYIHYTKCRLCIVLYLFIVLYYTATTEAKSKGYSIAGFYHTSAWQAHYKEVENEEEKEEEKQKFFLLFFFNPTLLPPIFFSFSATYQWIIFPLSTPLLILNLFHSIFFYFMSTLFRLLYFILLYLIFFHFNTVYIMLYCFI